MRPRSEAILYGCARLVSARHSIGLPIFSAYGSNRLWIPETDGDLRITRFIHLTDDAGLNIQDSVPPVARRKFGIGDYAPIPYWINEELWSVSGDAYPDQVADDTQGAPGATSVILDVRRLLDDARSGRFKLKLQAAEAHRIEGAFPDLFEDAPVHSKYWVSRYRLAVTQARMETKPPHAIDDRLLSLGREWLTQFGTKTDYPRMRALLGRPDEGIYSPREVANVMFVFIIDRIQRGKIAEIVRWVLNDRDFLKVFPGGIYRFFINNGWPNAPFSYKKNDDILEPLRSSIANADCDLLSAIRGLSYVYFGKEEAPESVNRFLLPYRTGHVERMTEAMRVLKRTERSNIVRDEDLLNAAARVVDAWDSLRWMDGIEYPEGRLRNLRKPIRGVGSDFIDVYRPLAHEADERAKREMEAKVRLDRHTDARYAKYEDNLDVNED